MNQWVHRHSEALWEASRALQRIQKDDNKYSSSARSSTGNSSWTGSRAGDTQRYPPYQAHSSTHEPFDENGRLRQEEGPEFEEAEARSQHSQSWWWHDQGWQDWQEGSWRSSEFRPPASWETEVSEFLPDFLSGFLLLHRSGLDAAERGNILAAIRGEFSTAAVEQALKEQWSDEDLQKRDRLKHSANFVDEDEEDLAALAADPVDMPDPSLDPEGHSAFVAEQETIESALEAIKFQKRTLREARFRQQQMKQSRKFYPNSKYQGGGKWQHGNSSSRDSTMVKCLKCGGPHNTHACTKKDTANLSEEQAEVVFNATIDDQPGMAVAQAAQSALNSTDLSEKIAAGLAVIDCGATSTLGSVTAVEALMKKNIQACGKDRVQVDPDLRPTFRFGNNSTKSCISTVQLGVDMGSKSGQMQIHVHDVPDQPILVSVKSLKALGAILDFSRNEVIYTKVCDRSVVPLQVAANGHLLMPLTGDLLAGSHQRATSFKSLAHE